MNTLVSFSSLHSQDVFFHPDYGNVQFFKSITLLSGGRKACFNAITLDGNPRLINIGEMNEDDFKKSGWQKVDCCPCAGRQVDNLYVVEVGHLGLLNPQNNMLVWGVIVGLVGDPYTTFGSSNFLCGPLVTRNFQKAA